MKPRTNTTTEQSEPPAVAGGLTQPTTEPTSMVDQLQPPATAGGSDIARLRAENEQLRTTIRLGQAQRQITGELARAGAKSPELLFDSVKTYLQFDDEGTLANAAAIVERLKTGFPEQFGLERVSSSIDGGVGARSTPQLTRETLAKNEAGPDRRA